MFAVLTRQTATQDRQGTAAKTNKRDKQGKAADKARRKRKKNRRKWRKSAVEAWGIFYINRKSLKNPQPISSFNTSKTPQNGFKTHLFASIFVYWTIFDLF